MTKSRLQMEKSFMRRDRLIDIVMSCEDRIIFGHYCNLSGHHASDCVPCHIPFFP